MKTLTHTVVKAVGNCRDELISGKQATVIDFPVPQWEVMIGNLHVARPGLVGRVDHRNILLHMRFK